MAEGRIDLEWSLYADRFRKGEWRAVVFRDLILQECRREPRVRPTLLDIGCGRGFDDDSKLQLSLSQEAAAYLGVEPDKEIAIQPCFTTVYRCLLEDAPIPSGSVDIAFAVMVLEHIENPEAFWAKLYDVLREGGVFWGFTMDARHWFARASALAEWLRLKDWYLDHLHAPCGQGYENYPVHYRINLPNQIRMQTSRFTMTTIYNLGKVGQLDYYFPRMFRWLGRSLDALESSLHLPGSILVVRSQK